MNVFLIETENNRLTNQLFSSWVKKNLPDWNIVRVGADGDDIVEQAQIALTKNISKTIHIGRPTVGAIIQMTMAFSMGMPVYALGLPLDRQEAAFQGILEGWSYENEDFERSVKNVLGIAA